MFSLHSHTHDEEGGSFWEEYFHLLGDPAHWLFEITVTLTFDVLIVALLYGIVVKKIILPKLRREVHKEIDAEHGFIHSEEEQNSKE